LIFITYQPTSGTLITVSETNAIHLPLDMLSTSGEKAAEVKEDAVGVTNDCQTSAKKPCERGNGSK